MTTLEDRVSQLENQVRRLLDNERKSVATAEPWWKKHSGAFKDSLLYDEAMRLASEYRRSQPTAADAPDEYTD